MTLETIYYIGQTVAVGLILGSLVFVGVQMRQNVRHMRAQILAARVERLIAQHVGFSDADKCAAYIRGNGGDPTPEAISQRQFLMQCQCQIAVMSENFKQHTDGMIDDFNFDAASAVYRRWLLDEPFCNFVRQALVRTDPISLKFNAYIRSLMPDGADG